MPAIIKISFSEEVNVALLTSLNIIISDKLAMTLIGRKILGSRRKLRIQPTPPIRSGTSWGSKFPMSPKCTLYSRIASNYLKFLEIQIFVTGPFRFAEN